MGVDFYTKDASACCSYSFWDTVRKHMIIASKAYLIANRDALDDKEHNDFYEKALRIFENLDEREMVSSFVSKIEAFGYHPEQCTYIDALNYCDLGGLYSLCYKSNCDGYYTAGDALDMITLFDTVKDFIELKSVKEFVYEHEESFYKVCEASVKNRCMITIA